MKRSAHKNPIEPMQSSQGRRGPRWGWIIAIFAVMILYAASNRENEATDFVVEDDVEGADYAASSSASGYSPSTSASPPSSMRLNEAQRKNYQSDPSSMGYSDADRDFLREQGVSEAEARAAESVAAAKGVF